MFSLANKEFNSLSTVYFRELLDHELQFLLRDEYDQAISAEKNVRMLFFLWFGPYVTHTGIRPTKIIPTRMYSWGPDVNLSLDLYVALHCVRVNRINLKSLLM
jgi:hypothetical protein